MWNWLSLGLESSHVIGLRIIKLMRGGKLAEREAQRMVTEKMVAAAQAGTSLMLGAKPERSCAKIAPRCGPTHGA